VSIPELHNSKLMSDELCEKQEKLNTHCLNLQSSSHMLPAEIVLRDVRL